MKKMIALLMAAILCLSLGACGDKTQTSESSMQLNTEQGIQTECSDYEQTAVAVVNIAVNPQFSIHVDNDGNVIKTECLNEDAKAVCAKVSVTGKSCKDAIVLILQETVNQGFLKDGGKIEISVAVAEEISNQMDTWNNTVMDSVTQVLSDNKLNADIAFSCDKQENNKEENSNPVVPADNMPSATDADGNTVIQTDRGYMIVDKNGNKIQEVHTADDGTVITLKFDENRNIIQAIHARSDGNTVTEDYDGNGNMIREVHVRSDGTSITKDYDGNGKIAFQRDEFADGSWTEKSFQNGVLTKEIRGLPDGASTQCIETEFYANGNIKSSRDYYTGSNSPYFEIRYYENGIKSYEYNVDGSLYTEITYDSKGNRLTENYREADGTRWELTYNPDGSRYGYTYYPDGSVWYNEWDAKQNQDLSAQKQIK